LPANLPVAVTTVADPRPLTTLLLCAVCCLHFVALTAVGGASSWDQLERWGYPQPYSVWEGGYWALVSTAFIHLEPWHLALNVYWWWKLGGPVERVLGRWRYLGFVFAAAWVSSGVQLGVSGQTGHGASGVVYALFGLLWVGRRSFRTAEQTLLIKTAPLFLLWLGVCVLATRGGVMEIANGAHLGGLLFGWVSAPWLVGEARLRKIFRAGSVAVIVLAAVPLFWAPWSAEWISYRSYKAHASGDYDTAIAGYRRSLDIGANRLWTLENLALAYHAKGALPEYEATLAEIRAIDPKQADRVASEVKAADQR
jgi:GlpG protein